MTDQTASATMLVRLREATVARLMLLRAGAGETLDGVVGRLAALPPASLRRTPEAPSKRPLAGGHSGPVVRQAKHSAQVLGQRLYAPTLGLLFASVVDLVADLDPTVLERLAQTKARNRRFISRSEAEIHPGRPDLPTVRSHSGWWISGNVGTADTQRALIALCLAASLCYGTDVRFRNSEVEVTPSG